MKVTPIIPTSEDAVDFSNIGWDTPVTPPRSRAGSRTSTRGWSSTTSSSSRRMQGVMRAVGGAVRTVRQSLSGASSRASSRMSTGRFKVFSPMTSEENPSPSSGAPKGVRRKPCSCGFCGLGGPAPESLISSEASRKSALRESVLHQADLLAMPQQVDSSPDLVQIPSYRSLNSSLPSEIDVQKEWLEHVAPAKTETVAMMGKIIFANDY
mmetsp:Transcript_101312/g.218717  ORF Transcript_101312/g.218717 Transcript_101312/m.218717 type:complete len:210 (+) Transcript_101312:55-684(+)